MSASGGNGDGHSGAFGSVASLGVSDDGRYVAFFSKATNLVSGDTNLRDDIFVRDRQLDQTLRVSVDSAETQANGDSAHPSMSADGRYVVFSSNATNLVSADTNNRSDVFRRDLVTGTTELISTNSSGAIGDDQSVRPRISANGRYVAFNSNASNLVLGDTCCTDIFVKDTVTGTTTRASLSSSGDQAYGTGTPAVSDDGRFVVFESTADNLVSGDTNGASDVFLRDKVAGTTKRVSVSSSGEQGNAGSNQPDISKDGRIIAFDSKASNLIPADANTDCTTGPNNCIDIFMHARETAVTSLVSVNSQGQQSNSYSQGPVDVSPSGRYIAFWASGTNMVPNDPCVGLTGPHAEMYLRDLVTAETLQVSVHIRADGVKCGGTYPFASVTSGGQYVAQVNNSLVDEDTNAYADVNLWDRSRSQISPGQAQGQCAPSPHAARPINCIADPVNTATGGYYSSATDGSLPGVGIPFSFVRSYNSTDGFSGPLGHGWRHNFQMSASVELNGDVKIQAEDGQVIAFTRRPDGSFVGVTGVRDTLTAVADGYLLKRMDGIKYRFNAQGRFVELADRNNNRITLAIGANGLPSSITDTVGRVITLSYNASNQLSGLAFPDGRTVSYGYVGELLDSVTDVRNGVTKYSYDASNRLTKIIDANNHTVVQNTYGNDGRVVEQLDARGNRSTYSWDPETGTSTFTDARGKTWKDIYMGNVLIQRIDPLGSRTTYSYDRNLSLSAVTDARGNTTTMTYDSRGNMLTRTAPPPLSYKESFSYNASNDVTSMTDSRGKVTTFTYDAAGNLIRMTKPGNVVTQYGRDPAGTGLLVSETNPNNHTTSFGYDAQANLTSFTTHLGFKTTMGYDGAGRMTSRVDPRGNAPGADPAAYRWTYTYDAAGNRKSETDPLGNTTAWTYDGVGNVLTRTDANNHTTTFGYDPSNHLTSVTATDTTVTSYGYDTVGNLTSRTDANTNTTTFAYDAANRLISTTSPLNQTWQYDYDGNGNRTKVTVPSGGTVTRSYDVLNRLTSISYSDGTPSVQYGYDGNGNLTSITDGQGTESRTYDDLNRLNQASRGTNAFAYTYDPAGNVTQRTYPDVTVITYAYDLDERLSSVTTAAKTTSYQYDQASNVTNVTLPSSNGHVATMRYDAAGRPIEVKNVKGSSTLSSFTYALDPVGNPNSVTTPSGTTSFTYDQLDRLKKACFTSTCTGAGDPFIEYTYDPVGNRKTEVRSSGTTSYIYNVADQLTSASGPSGTLNYGYDANGNQTSAGSRTFTYNLANQQTSTTSGRTTITYSYDGAGSRVLASSGSQASNKTKYLWDSNWSLPALALEQDGSDALRRRYIHGHDVISMTTGGADYYFHKDVLGSVANLSSSTGAAQWTYTYEPFGKLRSEVKNATKAPTNLLRFTGQLFDLDTGLYHLRARQYDPALGRFLQVDPVAPPLTDPFVGAYIYVNNRPTVLVDPAGEFPWLLLLGAVALGSLINSTGYAVRVAATDEGFRWRGYGASALSGGIAGGATVALGGGLGLAAGLGVSFAGGALGTAVGGAICGGVSLQSSLIGGAVNTVGGIFGMKLFPRKPIAANMTSSFTGAVQTATSDPCGSGK